jgi:hypothetical protein
LTTYTGHGILESTPLGALPSTLFQELRKGDEPMFPMKKPIRLLGMVFQID